MENQQRGKPKGSSLTNDSTPYSDTSNEITLREFIYILLRGKWIIIGITFLFAVGSIVVALLLPNIYTAEAKLAPTQESQSSSLRALTGQFGGLASLAGINLPQGETDNAQIAQEIMQSRAFITGFVERRGVLVDLMAVKRWNRSSGEVEYDPDIYDVATETWVRDVNPPKQTVPTPWEYVQEFRDIFRINEDAITGMVTIQISHKSPIIAKQWVDWIVEDINNVMRRRDIEEAQRSIRYIEDELENARLTTTQQVYASLLEQQTQTIMLANVRPEYVYQVIDPAVIPEEKSRPLRALIVIVSTMIGGFLSIFILCLAYVMRQPQAAN